MTPDQLSDVIVAALTDLSRRERLNLPEGLPTQVVVERPKVREHGDYATNIALQLAKKAGRKPRELAQDLADVLIQEDGISAAEVAGPGFLNLRVAAAAQGALAADIVAQGSTYGSSSELAGRRINVEFVSANPTGPIHLGGTRWAAAGDSLARVFTFAGADVTREYYFNDHGAQIDRFAASLLAAAQGEEPPEDGYVGAYITEIADAVIKQEPTVLSQEPAVATETFRRLGVEMMFDQIKAELHDFGVDFDVYFHENTLHETGAVDHAIERLKNLGMMYESDGAWWLRTTDFGDDKDRVVIRSNGSPAYLSGDLAYYLNKRERGFDLVVIMLGADHHGYVGRMMAMCQAFGDKPHENLEIPIGQMVNLVRDGQPLRMSKRAGTVVTMTDLVDAVGVDAARYALVRYSADSPIDIDLALWSSRTSDNPVFYVQYAHARMSSILRTADAAGLAPATAETFDPALLAHEREGLLLRALADFPRVVGKAVEWREPHRIARYLEETAGAFHRFYDACRVLPRDDEQASDLHRARLLLLSATRQVLANGLGLLGVSAPDRM